MNEKRGREGKKKESQNGYWFKRGLTLVQRAMGLTRPASARELRTPEVASKAVPASSPRSSRTADLIAKLVRKRTPAHDALRNATAAAEAAVGIAPVPVPVRPKAEGRPPFCLRFAPRTINAKGVEAEAEGRARRR